MMEACHFKMPAEMARKIIEIARDRDVTVGQILRDLIAQEIERVGQGMSPLTPEQRRFEALRVDLAPELRETGGWPAMQARLRAKGYELRLAGRVLALHSYPKGHRICLASDLGLAHDDLAARLGEAFPGHPDRQEAPRSRPPTQATPQAIPQAMPQPTAQEATGWPEHGATPAPAVAPPPPSYAPDPDAAPWPDRPDRTDPPAHRVHVNAAPNGLHLAEPAGAKPRQTEPATSYSPPPPSAAVQQAQAHARALAEAHAQALSRAQAQASGQSQAQAHPRAKPQPTPRQDPRVPPAWLTSQRETA